MAKKPKPPAPRLNGDLDGLIAKLKKSMNDTITEVEVVFDSASGAVEELKELRAITQHSIDCMEAFLEVVEKDFTISQLNEAKAVLRTTVDHIKEDFEQTKARRAALLPPPTTPTPTPSDDDALQQLLTRLASQEEGQLSVEDILILNPHMSYEEAQSFVPEANKPGGFIPIEPELVSAVQKTGFWREKLGQFADRIRMRAQYSK